MLDSETQAMLVARAKEARAYARTPMTGFNVGAALLTAAGEVFTGCNVELQNILYAICAERTALVKAVSEGAGPVVAIAVIAGSEQPTAPCGQCRQALYDFNPEMQVIMATTQNDSIRVESAAELLPHAYRRPRR